MYKEYQHNPILCTWLWFLIWDLQLKTLVSGKHNDNTLVLGTLNSRVVFVSCHEETINAVPLELVSNNNIIISWFIYFYPSFSWCLDKVAIMTKTCISDIFYFHFQHFVSWGFDADHKVVSFILFSFYLFVCLFFSIIKIKTDTL